MKAGIQETRELIAALTAVIVRTKNDLSDGKMSVPEIIGFAADFGVIRTGVSGMQNVPAELADLDAEEREVLLSDIKVAMTNAGLSHMIADSAEEILRWGYNTVQMMMRIKNAPPAALPA